MSKSRVTITDVAREAGVTGATVSRALRSGKLVKDTTRQKVLEAAERLGYEPSLSARLLRMTPRPNATGLATWGMVAPLAENTIFPSVLTPLIGMAQEREVQMLPRDSRHSAMLAGQGMRDLISNSVSALCVAPPDYGMIDPETLYMMARSEIPIVAIDGIVEGLDCPVVSLDYREAGRLSARHLIESGCQRLGFVVGRWWYMNRERFIGFKEEILRAGQPFDDEQVVVTWGADWAEKAGDGRDDELAEEFVASTTQYIKSVKGIDGIDCGHDERALLLMDVCRRQGLRCPQDVKIVGCGNTREGLGADVSVTTFGRRGRIIAGHVVSLVERMMAGEYLSREDSIFIEPELISRESTAAEAAEVAN